MPTDTYGRYWEPATQSGPSPHPRWRKRFAVHRTIACSTSHSDKVRDAIEHGDVKFLGNYRWWDEAVNKWSNDFGWALDPNNAEYQPDASSYRMVATAGVVPVAKLTQGSLF